MIDVLAFAAHPDDAELHIAGTLMRTADLGGSFAICDLTRGERGTRGSSDLRAKETHQANLVLGIDESLRWNLGIPDGDIRVTPENVELVVRAIRYFRPSIVLFPCERDRHPDHQNAHRLVHEGWFNAGLRAVTSEHDGEEQMPHRPERAYAYFHAWEGTPDFIVDIDDQFTRKMDAIGAYASQFTMPGSALRGDQDEPATFISGEEFMEYMIARMRRLGFMIGARYGEGFATIGSPLKIRDLRDTL